MLLKIFKYDHIVLKTKGSKIEKIDDALKELANDMIETMNHHDGCGLAAHQIGRSIQIAVVDAVETLKYYPSTAFINGKEIDIKDIMPLVLINPEVKVIGNSFEALREGCLSLPEVYATVNRVCHIDVSYQDINTGEIVHLKAKQFLARLIQHEVDHLNGKIILDYISNEEYLKQEALIEKIKSMTAISI